MMDAYTLRRSSWFFANGSRVGRPKPAAVAGLAAAALFATMPATQADAALTDEIQVYTDDINAPRESGLELHVNTTPSGRSTPEYPGEVTPAHGWRITPEFSYGLGSDWEAGLYLPASIDSNGRTDLAGAKVRLKWLPLRPAEGAAGWFAGANVELSRLRAKYEASRDGGELRLMVGHRSADWLFALNPVFGKDLSPGYRAGAPDLSLGFKVAKTLREGFAAGVEYYTDLGTTTRLLPSGERQQTAYAAIDWETKSGSLNFGIGRGLNSITDRWTVKAIIGFELR